MSSRFELLNSNGIRLVSRSTGFLRKIGVSLILQNQFTIGGSIKVLFVVMQNTFFKSGYFHTIGSEQSIKVSCGNSDSPR